MGYRRGCLADLLGDAVAYRGLRPQDPRLPGFAELREELGLGGELPRKGSAEYARVVVRILEAAQGLRGAELRRIVYVGDTRHNDGRTIAALGELVPVRGFIAAEDPGSPPRMEVSGGVVYANRWGLIGRFLERLRAEDFPLDEGTAVIVDLDKTAFGARGRNSAPVDAARIAAAERIAASVLGGEFDREGFQRAYRALNDPRYHAFTGDNQDLVVFAALVVSSGAYPLRRLEEVSAGKVRTFAEFLSACEGLPPGLARLRGEIEGALARGDPTPFKAFRRLEYEETLARMDLLPDGTPPERVLAEEIVLTAEVWEFAGEARERGALLFGLTDKPDEASIPPAGHGGSPLHRAVMKILGGR
ncbi:MAG: hypothetical protein GXO72_04540 [Caldiserica bacterium]|nr:hypothetical protein [Caldisericota bacterium]